MAYQSEYLSRGGERYTFYGAPVRIPPQRPQCHKEVPVSAPSPVHGLSWGMFQDAFRQLGIEVDEQRPMNENRFPTPGLRVP